MKVYYDSATEVVELIDTAKPAPPQNPTITAFTATPAAVNPGQPATLSGTVTNAVTLTLNGAPIAGLPQVVTPTATTTYMLLAEGAPGTTPATSSVEVTVNPVTVNAPIVARHQIGVQGQPLNIVCFLEQYAGDASYERYQRHICLTTTATTLAVRSRSGGGSRPWAFPRYAIVVSPNPDMSAGVIRSTLNVTTNPANFVITLGNEEDAPHFARVLPVDAANKFVPLPNVLVESYPVFGMWVDRNGTAKNHRQAIKQNGSFEWSHPPVTGGPIYSDVALVDKAALVMMAQPLPFRQDVTSFSTALPKAQVARVPLIPTYDNSDAEVHLPSITTRGITVTECTQNYTPQRLFDDLPAVHLLDGPRGVCTTPYSLVVRPGSLVGRVYVCSPWSFAVVDSTGHKITLFGLRHRPGKVPYYETPIDSTTHPAIEIVGDFDPSIPMDERYPLEPWFMLWDKRSLLVDDTAPPIHGLPPHLPYTLPSGEVINGPRCFIGDRRGWVWELRFNGKDHTTPAKIRRWITGLSDPWGADNMPSQNTFALAERTTHRICEWSMDAPNTKVRTILQSAGTGSLVTFGASGNRRWKADLTAARALPICAPESVRIKGNRMTVGALAQEQVRAFDLTTGAALGVVATPTVSYGGVGPYWVDHDVSDGTIGPAGTVFTQTFYNSYNGHPQAFLPGGGNWDYQSYVYGVDRGRGSGNGGHYPTGVGCGMGRLFAATGSGGIDYYCMADAYDPVVDLAKAERGWRSHRAAGLSLIHNPYCMHLDAYPVKKGVDVDRDYWYTMLRV